jgi:RimJ/RimL family protein N-acetyltransferase
MAVFGGGPPPAGLSCLEWYNAAVSARGTAPRPRSRPARWAFWRSRDVETGKPDMASFTLMRTERLLLRMLEPPDAAVFYEYRSNPAVSKYQSWKPKSVSEIESFIRNQRIPQPNTVDFWVQLAICLRETGILIGDCGMHFPQRDSPQVEIGFTIAPAHQRRGYALEAVRAIIGYLFHDLKKHRVYASVDPRNAGSISLLEQLPMRKEAHFRKSIFFEGEWVDDIVYAVLEKEWH